jgi:hypothetical protein
LKRSSRGRARGALLPKHGVKSATLGMSSKR